MKGRALPAVTAFLAVLVLAGAGWGLVIYESGRIPTRSAHLDGLNLEVVRARWVLDQMFGS